MENSTQKTSTYTCNDYRAEMILLGLQKQLAAADLTPEDKDELLEKIALVEKEMGMD